MNITVLNIESMEVIRDVERVEPDARGWHWIDITIDPEYDEAAPAMLAPYHLDPIAVHDAFNEIDAPKFDDFGNQAVLILHGLRDGDRLTTYELDCFITPSDLITVHTGPSRAVDALQDSIRAHPELASGGGAEVAALRRVAYPQREALDLIRSADSMLLSQAARRRFSDVFDVAARTVSGLDAARSVMSEAVDAYRGAEARSATEVSKVLTIYAAILLPLSLIVGFFGMNHENLPTIGRQWGWLVVTISMLVVVALSMGVFISQGWVRRPSGKAAGAALGRGLAEAARAPAQVASAVFAISTLPVKSAKTRLDRTTETQVIDE